MTDYISIHRNTVPEDRRGGIMEYFFSSYVNFKARDIYRWLWEGEFGIQNAQKAVSVAELNAHVYQAYQEEIRAKKRKQEKKEGSAASIKSKLPVCEYLGLAQKYIKVNLIPYVEQSCPLKRLLEIQNEVLRDRPSKFRFKQDWNFAKNMSMREEKIKRSAFEDFERRIGFHMLPEVEFSIDFIREYYHHYVVVSQKLFFNFFPEYRFPK